MPTRPCLYCLCFNGSCVFADFDVADGKLFIVRISFDGYGCYRVNNKDWAIGASDSKRMSDWIESNNVDHAEMREVLTDYFRRRQTSDFDDALAHNGLPT